MLSYKNVITLIMECHNTSTFKLWSRYNQKNKKQLPGYIEPKNRPNRLPKRVVKLLRMISGLWSVTSPQLEISSCGMNDITLNMAVGPFGR